MQQKDYFYVTFNLSDWTYKLYPNLDNKNAYINVQSTYSPNIIKQLPKTVEQRLSNNSSIEIMFNKAAPLYEKALSEASCDVKFRYCPNKNTETKQKQKQNKKMNIIWLNLPCSKIVVTKVDHYLDKHFPRQHKLRKICTN